MNQLKTVQQRVNQYKVSLDYEWVSENPHMKDDHYRMNHFKVTLRAVVDGRRRQYTTFYSMGLGLDPEPKADDVLNCLILDSSSYETARDLDDFAAEFGYKASEAAATYRACKRTAKALQRVFGEGYEDLLYETESL